MPSTATVTAKAGPALTATAVAFNAVQNIVFFPAPKNILQIADGNVGIREFDITASTTITMTISAGVVALTIV